MPTDPASARSSRRRKQRLTDYVVSKTGADIEVILTSAIPTAAVTSQSALEDGQELGLFDEQDIDQLQMLAGGSDAEYLMFITTNPANLDRLPFSDQLAADRMQQYGLALHESLHITYTDQHGVNRLLASEIEDQYQEAFHQFWNAGEDGAIERLARVNGGEKVEIRQTATHTSLRRPATEPPSPPRQFTFAEGVIQAMIDHGIYNTGITGVARDPDANGWVFQSKADRDAFEEVLCDLEALIGRIQHEPNSVTRAEAMVEFWHEHIQPRITPDEAASQNTAQQGASQPSPDTQEDTSNDQADSTASDGDTPSGDVSVSPDISPSPLSQDSPEETADATDLAPETDESPDEEPAADTGGDATSESAEADENSPTDGATGQAPANNGESDSVDDPEDEELNNETTPASSNSEAAETDGPAADTDGASAESDPSPDHTSDGEDPPTDQYTLDAFNGGGGDSDASETTNDTTASQSEGEDTNTGEHTNPSEDAPDEAGGPSTSSDTDTQPAGQPPDQNDPMSTPKAEDEEQPSGTEPTGDNTGTYTARSPESMTEAILESAEDEVEDQHSRAERDLNADGPGEDDLVEGIEDLRAALKGGEADLGEIEFMPREDTKAAPQRWRTIEENGQELARVLDAALPDTAPTGDRHGTRSGKLSKRRLAGVPVGKTNVFRRKRQPEQKDYDIVLVLDRSGSMVYNDHARDYFDIPADIPHPVEIAEETVAAFARAFEHPQLNANVAIIDFYNNQPRLIKPFTTDTAFVKDSLLSSKAKQATPLTEVTDLASSWLDERGNDSIIITVTDGEAADVPAFQDAVNTTSTPVAGITLSLHTPPGEPEEDLLANEESFDRHTFVYDGDDISDELSKFAYDFIGLHATSR